MAGMPFAVIPAVVHVSSIKRVFSVALIACVLFSSVSCSSFGSSGSQDIAAHRDLERELRKQKSRVLRLSAEIQYLESELARTRELLEQVERQFITFERNLYTNETRASAVASLAEARLAHDKMARTHGTSETSKNLMKMVLAKIEASDQLLAKTRYNGSVYFSRRALRLLAGEQDRKLMRVVSVENANLRRGPGLNYEVVTRLAIGTTLFQLDKKNEWMRIQTRTGVQGWIHTSVTGTP